jgi:hypothetical protein
MLELGDGPLFDIHDTYINSVKEVRVGLGFARRCITFSYGAYRQTLYEMARRKA